MLAALAQVLFGQEVNAWVDLGVIGYAGFVVLTLSRLRRDTVLILLVLVLVGWFLLIISQRQTNGGRQVDMFSYLPLYCRLWRWCATASTMPSVRRTQQSRWRNCQHRHRPADFTLRQISLVVLLTLDRCNFCLQPSPQMLMQNDAGWQLSQHFAAW